MVDGNPKAIRFLALLALMIAVALCAVACGQEASPSPPAASRPTPPAVPTSVAVSASLIPHPLAGRDNCLLCHGVGLLQPMPADHGEYPTETCTVCHDLEPAAVRPTGATSADMGQAIWSERYDLSCRDCHGAQAEGAFGPPLANTTLDADAFRERVRSPRSNRMPPIATAPDDPAMERSGIWISDADLMLVYAWLTGTQPDVAAPEGKTTPPSSIHGLRGYEDCLLCHGPGMAEAFPEDHTGRTKDMCLVCHTMEEGQ